MADVDEAQVSEAQIAVHWREEEYEPPASFVEQANAADPAIFDRFTCVLVGSFMDVSPGQVRATIWRRRCDVSRCRSGWASRSRCRQGDPAPLRRRLLEGVNTDKKIIDVIRSGSVIGRAPIVSMPHWGGIIPDAQLRTLVAYIKTLKSG